MDKEHLLRTETKEADELGIVRRAKKYHPIKIRIPASVELKKKKKPTEEQTLYDTTYMKYLQWATSGRQKINGHQGLGERGEEAVFV